MHIDDEIKEKVNRFLDRSGQHMGDALDIRFLSFSRDEVTATMPVNENTVQPFGILHGGASVALAETLASIGGWLNLEDDSKTTVGIEINANHVRSVKKGGLVTGRATPVHTGRKIQIWEIAIKDEQERLVCTSRCTLAVVDSY